MLNIEKYKDEIVNRYNDNRGTLSQVVTQILKEKEPLTYRKLLPAERPFSLSTSEVIEWLASEYEEPVLNRKKMEYLAGVLEPFANRVEYVMKVENPDETEFVHVKLLEDGTGGLLSFPAFKKGEMYKGMKVYEKYTPEALGILVLNEQQPENLTCQMARSEDAKRPF